MNAEAINTNVGNPVSNRSYAGHICRSINPSSQNGKLLIHLLRESSISQLEATELYRIHRLASRVNDLKNLGVVIERTAKVDPTGVRYVRYALV
jgi:hypothetical protein